MDLLERGLCESHTKVPCESMIEPEESKVDTIMMMMMMVMMMMMIIIIITIITITFIERIPSRDQHPLKFAGTKERVYMRKEFNSDRIGLEHQHGRRFIVLEHQYGRRDVM